MSPVTPVDVLEAILKSAGAKITSAPRWFEHDDDHGEAQAVIETREHHRYAVSLEPLL